MHYTPGTPGRAASSQSWAGELPEDFGSCTIASYIYSICANYTPAEQDQPVTLIGNPYTFTARRYDLETGLYYYRARYYNPQIGRFLQLDPAYQGMNWYAYCGNNPVNCTDPTGEVYFYPELDPCNYTYEWTGEISVTGFGVIDPYLGVYTKLLVSQGKWKVLIRFHRAYKILNFATNLYKVIKYSDPLKAAISYFASTLITAPIDMIGGMLDGINSIATKLNENAQRCRAWVRLRVERKEHRWLKKDVWYKWFEVRGHSWTDIWPNDNLLGWDGRYYGITREGRNIYSAQCNALWAIKEALDCYLWVLGIDPYN